MKKFILNTTCFLAFAAGVYSILLLFTGIFGNSLVKKNLKFAIGSYGHIFSRIREADTTKNIDVLFLGSSHTYRGYDPRIFSKYNLRSFNLGSSSQTPIQTEILVNRYLTGFKPKLVILDVYPQLFSNDGVESGLDLISNMEINTDLVKMALHTKNVKVYNTLLYSFFREKTGLHAKYIESKSKGADTYVGGGYVQSYQNFKEKRKLNDNTYHPIELNQVEAFDRIIKRLKKEQIDYVLIQAPVTNDAFLKMKNGQAIDSIALSRGHYYNFNTLLNLPDSVFSDEDHLNQKGVNIFNEALIARLVGDKLLFYSKNLAPQRKQAP